MERQRRRRCKSCGALLPLERIRLCESCQAAGMGYEVRRKSVPDVEELLRIAKRRSELWMNPLEEMTMEEINAIARHYAGTGYGSYGKLKAYVRATGKLPPEERRKE